MQHANKNCVNKYVVGDDVDVDLYPFLLRYKDGRIERLLRSPFVLASDDPTTNRGVATRDVVVDHVTGVSARLFLPSLAAAMAGNRRLPVVVYIHGGSFCTESAFCRTYHRYATSLAAAAGALVVSVEYRLAPEHPIPAAYDDAWSALRWATSPLTTDPWLAAHADPRRTFLVGDSAGGNIAYHTAVRASLRQDDVTGVEGVVIVQPYFWGAERLPSEASSADGTAVLPVNGVDRLWPFVTAGKAGNEDPRINPTDEEIASLTMTCRRVMVAVAKKDTLRERGVRLFERVRDCYDLTGGGEVTLVESEGEDHGFHLYNPLRATSRSLMESIVQFINRPPAPEKNGGFHLHAWEGKSSSRTTNKTLTRTELVMLGVPSRPFRDVFDYGVDMKQHCSGTICMSAAYGGTSKIGRRGNDATSNMANYGLFKGPVRPNKAYKGPAGATAFPGVHGFTHFF
ncbi:hypothetical protein HU200_016365 [Digitaria exilis]|uniref:Alpha/beta hydrolase fold-3 domain-containing protein n=1 Tax=Digitaria exilis TaxID=1010633 RepID=A0A835F8S1_9POAL|nr:hypothetical protein HU200_016365 [Digitaria exilis]CAB3455597.1 unnamed protein product [Digitaria exilis]